MDKKMILYYQPVLFINNNFFNDIINAFAINKV